MDSLIHSKRDLIKVKNGYFKYQLYELYNPQGAIAAGHNCEWKFTIPPLNEMGFSDKYSQALVRITKATLFNQSAAAIQGYNQIFFTKGGANEVHPLVVLQTDIPCRNQLRIIGATAAGGSEKHNHNLDIILEKSTDQSQVFPAGELDGIDQAECIGAPYQLQVGNKIALEVDDGAAAGGNGASKFVIPQTPNSWKQKDNHSSIWDDGLLCANPCGTTITFRIRNIEYDETLCLHTPDKDTGAGNTSCLSATLEIQLLPNP